MHSPRSHSDAGCLPQAILHAMHICFVSVMLLKCLPNLKVLRDWLACGLEGWKPVVEGKGSGASPCPSPDLEVMNVEGIALLAGTWLEQSHTHGVEGSLAPRPN